MEDVIKTKEHLEYLVGKIFGRFWTKGFRMIDSRYVRRQNG